MVKVNPVQSVGPASPVFPFFFLNLPLALPACLLNAVFRWLHTGVLHVGADHVAPLSSISHTDSRHSRVALRASSTTACGMARFGRAPVPLVPSVFLPFTVLPFSSAKEPLTTLVEPLALGETAVSWRTSSMTRRRRAGNEDTSPERRRERAWF